MMKTGYTTTAEPTKDDHGDDLMCSYLCQTCNLKLLEQRRH